MCAAMSIAETSIPLVNVYAKPQEVETRITPSRLTVSFASRASSSCSPMPVVPSCARDDMALQKEMVEAHKQAELAAFIAKHEKTCAISEADRRRSIIMLLNTAAQRDIDEGSRAGYPQQVVDFMRQTWAAFIQQAKDFYQEDAHEPFTMELSRNALENTSSIGVWFTGPQISLPLRRYTVQVVGADGAPQNITAVGLLSFTYSTYVMHLRSMSQQSALDGLARMQEQLGTDSLFLPQILVAPS
ncbi:conserved hypothetical protein [Leishmania major strain Friedlin]|uniref:Uncharacterized protein n=1 Tax=Leishmania major TaxID=5664 RepID=Q4QBY4_LEIMA|nr:conserved hypothetical protein [Leishmania major strain Friedlin]CAG9573877.1 hypothetical_protein_-_conserved [Leishmania major strain Friedlin]CAJ03809.1 conserved hypothetical protein [Leishmania major strain Friedlin]|eukprot:XP_001683164.1 conserved hypothetical protein [Leishmania major strain Friedlin]